MSGDDRSWTEVRIGISPDEALEFLQLLATDEALRTALEESPRETLLQYNIEYSEENAPDRLKLPAPEVIQHHVDSLSQHHDSWAEGAVLPHGFAVLLVAHGNGVIPPIGPRQSE
jgi:hypothetical protein